MPNALLCALLIAGSVASAQVADPKSAILGTWKGTSTCVKGPGNEACRDELVIYHFMDISGRDSVLLKAEKLVGGRTEPMDDLPLGYDRLKDQWSAEFRNARVHIRWTYAVHGSAMSGTCSDVPGGMLRRNVKVVKD